MGEKTGFQKPTLEARIGKLKVNLHGRDEYMSTDSHLKFKISLVELFLLQSALGS